MKEKAISFPAPEKPKPQPVIKKKKKPESGIEFGKLTLDYSGSTSHFFFQTEDDQETESFEDVLSLLNYFGSKGWSVAFKEHNEIIYLQRNLGGN